MNCAAPVVLSLSTLSSQRATMSRSCIRNASAMPCSRARASSLPVTSGSPPGLALVITSNRSRASLTPCSQPAPAGRPAASWNSRYWIGVLGSITPSTFKPGATPASRAALSSRMGSSTIGRSGDCSSACSASPQCTQRAAPARLAATTANGFSSRCLRSRSRATVLALRASHARWNPPRPLIATILPARSSPSVAAIGSPSIGRADASTSASAGPHTGQAFGSAWKRRCSGSVYSRRHCGHCANGAMLVWERS